MSRNKRQAKGIKRKYYTSNHNHSDTVGDRLARKVKRAVKNDKMREYKQIETSVLIKQGNETLKELRFIHYYIIFAKIIFEHGLIKGHFNYDVKKYTLMIKSIATSLKNAPLLSDDEIALNVELYDVSERLITLSKAMDKYISFLNPYHNYLSGVVMELGKSLPELPNGRVRERWEVENEVLRLKALSYISQNVFNQTLEPSTTDEVVCNG